VSAEDRTPQKPGICTLNCFTQQLSQVKHEKRNSYFQCSCRKVAYIFFYFAFHRLVFYTCSTRMRVEGAGEEPVEGAGKEPVEEEEEEEEQMEEEKEKEQGICALNCFTQQLSHVKHEKRNSYFQCSCRKVAYICFAGTRYLRVELFYTTAFSC
jgi:hypothetical protein